MSPYFEGLSVRFTSPNEKGSFLLRMSLHDPVKPLNIESDVKGGVEAIASKLKKLLAGFQGLNTNILNSES